MIMIMIIIIFIIIIISTLSLLFTGANCPGNKQKDTFSLVPSRDLRLQGPLILKIVSFPRGQCRLLQSSDSQYLEFLFPSNCCLSCYVSLPESSYTTYTFVLALQRLDISRCKVLIFFLFSYFFSLLFQRSSGTTMSVSYYYGS